MYNLFVTVGTTNFDNLIKAIDQPEVYSILKQYRFKQVTFQTGNGEYIPQNFSKESNIEGSYFKLKSSLEEDYNKADLVICHCGAGTCMEALRLKKKLIVVINDSLMDNHQLDLFEALTSNNFCHGVKKPDELKLQLSAILDKSPETFIKEYPEPKKNIIEETETAISSTASSKIENHPGSRRELLEIRSIKKRKTNSEKSKEIFRTKLGKKKDDADEDPPSDSSGASSASENSKRVWLDYKNKPYRYPVIKTENLNVIEEDDLSEIFEDDSFVSYAEMDTRHKKQYMKKKSVSYKRLISKSKKYYKTNYKECDPYKLIKKNELSKVKEAYRKDIINKSYIEIEGETMTENEKSDVINNFLEYYRNHQENYYLCNCRSCQKLLMPFMIKKNFERERPEIKKKIVDGHEAYLKTCLEISKLEDVVDDIYPNIFYQKIFIDKISITKHISFHNNTINPFNLVKEEHLDMSEKK